ncbi:hypothetical protein K431DRAFT_233533 [Polychaeton citri CBS 116435]|uniref:Acyltransferase 3 domain-containing protein n=1 Tax=Polychaeton citri CBS 116435 TaxID=1314669 RepID=A0A9P4Q0K8_9PEZI|nr:hypothetical protein K431DRAFT_233533 [Polychaeton citri CBS 116435]
MDNKSNADLLQNAEVPTERQPLQAEKKGLAGWLDAKLPGGATRSRDEGEAENYDAAQDYLTGLRGVLAIMTFLWMFLQTFAPATVKGAVNDTGPDYQLALRKSLSVLFWNDSLIYSSIIFLSARTICLPFLLNSTKTQLASCVLRRGVKLWIPCAASLVTVYIVFTKALGGNQFLYDFQSLTSNYSMHADIYIMPSSLVNFNSLFNVFWISHNVSYQAGSWAFPTQTLWIVSTVFQQSYTVFAAMVVIPFTRASWRIWGAILFILTAWWVYSWAWFSITGLLIADLVINMDLKRKLHRPLPYLHFPAWLLAFPLMAAGFAMQFVWVAARPDLMNAELSYHTGIYNYAGLYTWNDTTAPQLRADIYLIIVGFFVLLEAFTWMQKAFGNPLFVYLGKRSYSYFLIQSIIMYSLGVKTCVNIVDGDLTQYPRATGIVFIACLLVTIPAAEIFYWLFDKPAKWFGRAIFNWIRE